MLKKYRTLRRRYVVPTYVQLCTRRLEPRIELDELTTVEGNRRACNVASCATHKEEKQAAYVLGRADPPGGLSGLERLAKLSETPCRHATGEYAGTNRIHVNMLLSEVNREHARQMHGGGLGRLVAVRARARLRQSATGLGHHSRRRRDVDHGGMMRVALALLEKWDQGHRQVELALDVQVEHLVPALVLGKVVAWTAPCEARVVDENIETRRMPRELGSERIAAGLGAQVGLQRDAGRACRPRTASSRLVHRCGDAFEIVELARRNVDTRTVLDQRRCHHYRLVCARTFS